MENKKHYVIIGGGIAAVSCAEGIRSVDKDGFITLVCGEPRPAYCRPLISYYLEGKSDIERMKYRPDTFYDENGIDVVFDTASSIDTDTCEVVLSSGDRIAYDEVCVATGSSPFVPPMEGLETVEKRFGFMTVDDALALESSIDEKCRVLIVGAGLIGLKCAEGICERVGSVTVCDLAPRVLSSILDDSAAKLIEDKLTEHGIKFLLGDTVARFEPNTAHMKSGADVDFDVLVLAVGVRANVSLVRDIGGNVGRGIVVDNMMRTSVPHIYAAGDCVQMADVNGVERVMAILPNAALGGKCAGVNMAGGESVFDTAAPMNAIGFFGRHALTAGSYEGNVREDFGDGWLRRFYIKDGYLCGFMLIGDENAGSAIGSHAYDRAGIYTSLIRNHIPLDTVDAEALLRLPSVASMTPEYRRTKMAAWKN